MTVRQKRCPGPEFCHFLTARHAWPLPSPRRPDRRGGDISNGSPEGGCGYPRIGRCVDPCMTALDTSAPRTGRLRRPTPDGCEESVQQKQPDPPIYRALLARWADAGRTLPGHRDPEWSQVATSPIWPSGPLFGG